MDPLIILVLYIMTRRGRLAHMDPFVIALLKTKEGEMSAAEFLVYCETNNVNLFNGNVELERKRARFLEFYESYRAMSRDVILPYNTPADFQGELQRDTVITLVRDDIRAWFRRTTSDVDAVINALSDAFIASFPAPIRLNDFTSACIATSNKANERFTHITHMKSTRVEGDVLALVEHFQELVLEFQ